MNILLGIYDMLCYIMLFAAAYFEFASKPEFKEIKPRFFWLISLIVIVGLIGLPAYYILSTYFLDLPHLELTGIRQVWHVVFWILSPLIFLVMLYKYRAARS